MLTSLFGLGGSGGLVGEERERRRLCWGLHGQWVAFRTAHNFVSRIACFVHGVAIHLGNSLTAAPVQSFALGKRWRRVRDDGEEVT